MKAWHCGGHDQQSLVSNLEAANIVKTPEVINALRKVDRAFYVPNGASAYDDCPQGIGWGATISAPHMHAHAMEELFPSIFARRDASSDDCEQTTIRILDVGCGSGYLTACLSRLAGDRSVVYGIDYIDHLVNLCKTNIRKADGELLDSGKVIVNVGDGWKGLPSIAPFDAIHVGAAAAFLPKDLATQLRVGGRMVIPIGPRHGVQALYKIDRCGGDDTKQPGVYREEDFRVEELMSVRYVPLVDAETIS
eukprot:CAMPEP_0195515248 /NCGR_PEP_ID=MMETSP0794_2-20130614/6385_1 /TAXON_ID=515487 /ORGANISM="Stephanopyxis turris, Strain CCMP 815" /LENGTH=249 /DNA_ID=CAMNT_0040643645 /DNA_START=154 /DNA_END=903 /DNA_ORIENTATION=+